MVQIDRRRFLQLAGGATAATAMSGGFADSIARAASIPARRTRGTIEDVEHIVVLMQENRSFDHYHGSMRGVRGFGDPHPARAAERQARVVPAHRERRAGGAAAVPPDRRRPRRGVPDGDSALVDRRARGDQPRPLRRMGAGEGHGDDGLPGAAGRPLPLRHGGRLHHLRRLLLLVHRQHRPEPLLHVDRLDRQRRRRRRAGALQRRARLRLDDLPRAAGGCGHLVEGVPGHRLGPERRGLLGLGRRPVHRQLRRQRRCCTSTRTATPSPATRCTRRHGPARTTRPGRTTSRSSPPTSPPASCRRSATSPRPRRSASTRTGRPTTAPGTSPRSSTR